MARRPDTEKHEKLTQKDLDELRYNLAHLSVDAVRRFYERAYEDCRMIYDRLLSPKQMQTLVQVWKQARKSPSSCWTCQRFDSVAEVSECTDHSRSADSPGLFAHRGAAFFIANPGV